MKDPEDLLNFQVWSCRTIPTWTPKVYRIMAFWAVLRSVGPLFYLLWGLGSQQQNAPTDLGGRRTATAEVDKFYLLGNLLVLKVPSINVKMHDLRLCMSTASLTQSTTILDLKPQLRKPSTLNPKPLNPKLCQDSLLTHPHSRDAVGILLGTD